MIHEQMKGKTISKVMTDGEFLYIFTTNGQRFRITWKEGEPVLDGIDVAIQL